MWPAPPLQSSRAPSGCLRSSRLARGGDWRASAGGLLDATARIKASVEGSSNGGKKEERMTLVFRVQVLPGGLLEVMTSKGAMSDEPLVAMD